MLAIGDALALTVMRMKKFTRDDFARFHPAGSLGIKLLKVGDLMRKGSANPTVATGATVHDALEVMTTTKAGAVAIVDPGGRVVGLLTDGDFRRLALQRRGDEKHAIDEVMTRRPTTIGATRLRAGVPPDEGAPVRPDRGGRRPGPADRPARRPGPSGRAARRA
jgi:arabinose-5-phosphate isomerase